MSILKNMVRTYSKVRRGTNGLKRHAEHTARRVIAGTTSQAAVRKKRFLKGLSHKMDLPYTVCDREGKNLLCSYGLIVFLLKSIIPGIP
jgi:hypothetical protein